MKQDEKKCPNCAENIKIDAAVCRHCGQEFSADDIAAALAARKAKTRKGLLGCGLGCGGLVVLLAVIGAIGSGVDNGASGNSEAEAQRLEATANSLDAAADKISAASSDYKSQFVSQYREILRVAKPCDEALSGLSGAAERSKEDGNVIQLMAATSAGQNACGSAATAIRAMSPAQGLPPKAAASTDNALRSCLRGYDRREQAFKRANDIVAGEGGDVQEAVQDIERSRGDITRCVVGYVVAATEAGVDAKLMQ